MSPCFGTLWSCVHICGHHTWMNELEKNVKGLVVKASHATHVKALMCATHEWHMIHLQAIKEALSVNCVVFPFIRVRLVEALLCFEWWWGFCLRLDGRSHLYYSVSLGLITWYGLLFVRQDLRRREWDFTCQFKSSYICFVVFLFFHHCNKLHTTSLH